jgi:hypothetical protein
MIRPYPDAVVVILGFNIKVGRPSPKIEIKAI